MGGLAGIAGLVLLVVWPRVVDAVPGGAFLSPFMLLLGAVLLVGGPLMAILGGAGRRAAAAAVEAALRRLEDPEVDRETTLRAATLLLLHASAVEGAAAPQGADPDEVARRIGGRLSLVRAVERYLVERGSVAPFVGGRA